MAFEKIYAGSCCEKLELDEVCPAACLDEKCEAMILSAATANAFSYVEVEGFLIYHDFDAKERRYQVLGFQLHDLVEKVEGKNFCGARKPDQYLQHAYLSGLSDPCSDSVFVEMECSDRCGQLKDFESFFFCEDEQEIGHGDV